MFAFPGPALKKSMHGVLKNWIKVLNILLRLG